MLKVIIVDDEKIVRLGLKSIIPWKENGFEICGLFDNGKEALDYFLKHNSDIIITDIKMEGMDGLQLLKNVKKLSPKTPVIVLSNYDDFNLVSNAFKEGITDYVLKQDISPEALIEILNRIKKNILEARSGQDKQYNARTNTNYSQKKDKGILDLMNYCLNDFEEDKSQYTQDYIEAINSEGNILFGPCMCNAISLYKSNDNGVKVPYDETLTSHYVINDFISETVSKYCKVFLCYQNVSSRFFCLMFLLDNEEVERFRIVNEIYKDIMQVVYSYFAYSCDIGFSSYKTTCKDIKDLLQEANTALDSIYFFEKTNTLQYDKLILSSSIYKSLGKYKDSIGFYIKCGDFAGIMKEFDKMFDEFKESLHTPVVLFKQVLIDLVCEICIQPGCSENVESASPKDAIEISIIKRINKSRSINDTRNILKSVINELSRRWKPCSKDIIDNVKDYVYSNYMRQITLKDVSRLVSVNSNYLCNLFKQKTGEHFSQFVRRVRIEQSIKLLKEGVFSTEEIAERVGYQNPNYFIKVFKIVTGRTLTEFKSF